LTCFLFTINDSGANWRLVFPMGAQRQVSAGGTQKKNVEGASILIVSAALCVQRPADIGRAKKSRIG